MCSSDLARCLLWHAFHSVRSSQYANVAHGASCARPRVYVVSPPPLYPPFPYDMNQTVINEVFAPLLTRIAANNRLPPVIDVRPRAQSSSTRARESQIHSRKRRILQMEDSDIRRF